MLPSLVTKRLQPKCPARRTGQSSHLHPELQISYSLLVHMSPKANCGIKCDCSAEREYVQTMQTDDESDTDYLEKLRNFSNWTSHGSHRGPADTARCIESRRYLQRVLHSVPVNIIVIIMASVDAMILVAVLLLEIEALKLDPGEQRNRLNEARFGLECVSIGIISIFIIEISMKLFAMGPKTFFRHWIEVLDLVVVVISLIVDAIIIAAHVAHQHSAHGSGLHQSSEGTSSDQLDAVGAAAGLLIVFRLWRIVGIMNATIVTIHGGLETRIEKLKEERKTLRCRVIQLESAMEEANLPIPKMVDDSEESVEISSRHNHAHQHRKHQRLHHHHNNRNHWMQPNEVTENPNDIGSVTTDFPVASHPANGS
ncbi:unnamed protein product [Dicrocoelium dendriticum]|nr:unnamed protein product [Dicrocoelium dendriticum]